MSLDKTDNVAPKMRLLFWCAFAGVVGISLIAFTFTIGNGRLSGPGICLALTTGVLVWVVRMLFQSARFLVSTGAAAEAIEEKAASGRRRKELEREYYNLKRALKELELDHSMGKVSSEDYQEIRSRYRERAVRILRQLDQGESYRAQIDADLRARQQGNAQPSSAPETAPAPASIPASPPPPAEPVVESAVAEVPEAAPAPAEAAAEPASEGLCAKCQTRNDGDAVFCKKCGQKLKAA